MKERDPDRFCFHWFSHVSITSNRVGSLLIIECALMFSLWGYQHDWRESSSWVRPATAIPLVLPKCSFTGSIRASMMDCSVWTYLFSSLVQVVFLTGLVWASLCKTKQMQLTPSHCHCGRVLQTMKRGDGRSVMLFRGCDMMTSLPQTLSEMQQGNLWLGWVLEDAFLCMPASSKTNAVPAFLLGNASEVCQSFAMDMGVTKHMQTLQLISQSCPTRNSCVSLLCRTVFQVYCKVNISISWSQISSDPWRFWP